MAEVHGGTRPQGLQPEWLAPVQKKGRFSALTTPVSAKVTQIVNLIKQILGSLRATPPAPPLATPPATPGHRNYAVVTTPRTEASKPRPPSQPPLQPQAIHRDMPLEDVAPTMANKPPGSFLIRELGNGNKEIVYIDDSGRMKTKRVTSMGDILSDPEIAKQLQHPVAETIKEEPQLQRERLQSLLGLTRETRKLFSGMSRDDKRTPSLMNQFAEVPAMATALKRLKEHFKGWDGLNIGVEDIKDQYQNARDISEVLATLEQEFGEKALKSLTYDITANGREAIEASFRRQLQAPRTVTPMAIAKAAALFRAAIDAKDEAAGQKALQAQSGSANVVYKLTETYFKVGGGGEQAAAVTEKLMWDIAVILGLEKQFVATKQTTLHTATQTLTGGIQPAQSGVTLATALNESRELQPQAIIDATLTSIVFGSWDLHSTNMIVDNEGTIKFFDNTRSMPNSNGFLSRTYGVISPYRSALMHCGFSYEPLSDAQRKTMLDRLDRELEKVDQVEAYLESQAKVLQTLPEGWLNQKGAVQAMRERMQKSIEFLQTNSGVSLRDLTMAINPDYKLNAALAIAERMITDLPNSDLSNFSPIYLQKNYLVWTGYFPMEHLIDLCARHKIDIEEVKQKCDELPFDEVVRWLCQKLPPKCKQNPDAYMPEMAVHCLQTAEKFKAALQARAVVDYKDIARHKIAFHKANIPFVSTDDLAQAKAWAQEQNQPLAMVEFSDGTLKAFISMGGLVRTVDAHDVLGKFVVHIPSGGALPPMTIEELQDWAIGKPSVSASATSITIKFLRTFGLEVHYVSAPGKIEEGQPFLQQVKGKEPPQFLLHIKQTGQKTAQQYEIDLTTMPGKIILNQPDRSLLPMTETQFQEFLLQP